jgi:hypothetical protein
MIAFAFESFYCYNNLTFPQTPMHPSSPFFEHRVVFFSSPELPQSMTEIPDERAVDVPTEARLRIDAASREFIGDDPIVKDVADAERSEAARRYSPERPKQEELILWKSLIEASKRQVSELKRHVASEGPDGANTKLDLILMKALTEQIRDINPYGIRMPTDWYLVNILIKETGEIKFKGLTYILSYQTKSDLSSYTIAEKRENEQDHDGSR